MRVVIVGAGPVGTLLGAELARLGVEHLTLESREAAVAGSRAIGIHSAALSAMSASGVTDRILAACLRVREGEARIGGKTVTTIRFDAVRAGSLASFPFVATLPQAATEAAIAATACSHGAAAPERGIRVIDVVDTGSSCRVVTDRGDVQADVVVIAAGSRSREISGLTRTGKRRAYPDRYVMADVRDDTDEGPRAIVHLHPDGVLESFPLPGGLRRYVAWRRSGAAETDDAADLRGALARRAGSPGDAVTTATSFGVGRFVVHRMHHGRVLAIGDAAHEVSPIGGQGLNLGLIDAATLAPLLAEWDRTGEPPPALAEWERRRRRAAGIAARIAALNTLAGRGHGRLGAAARDAGIRLAPAPLLARAYAMGFDPDARAPHLTPQTR